MSREPETPRTALGVSKHVKSVCLRLQRISIDLHEAVDALDETYLTDPEAAYLDLPLSSLTLVTARLAQALYEARKIDDAPRRRRLALVDDEEQAA